MLQSQSTLTERLRAWRRRLDASWSMPTSDLSLRLTMVRGSRERVAGHTLGLRSVRARAGRTAVAWSADETWGAPVPAGAVAGSLQLPAAVWAAPAVLDLEIELASVTESGAIPPQRGVRGRPSRSSHLFFWNGRPCEIEVLVGAVVADDGSVRATVEDVLVFL